MTDKIIIKAHACGQGDCLTIEWLDNGTGKIGIIDCNKENNNVQNLYQYITSKGYSSIDFIIMTHPHTDHYSGFNELLEIISNSNKIESITNFYSSVGWISRHFGYTFKNFVERIHNGKSKVKYRSRLSKLLQKTMELTTSGLINTKFDGFQYLSSHNLSSSLQIVCISPSNDEIEKFAHYEDLRSKANYDFSTQPENNPLANFMSTSFILLNKIANKVLAIFTSDLEKDSLERISNNQYLKSNYDLSDASLIQIPHHGSQKNHIETFWDTCSLSSSHSFISVGQNDYGHPNCDVVNYFKENSKDFDSTTVLERKVSDDGIAFRSSRKPEYFLSGRSKTLTYLLDNQGNCIKL